MIQLWVTPASVASPTEDWTDADFFAITRNDDSDPQTYGEFFVGNAKKLAHPENWNAWWRLVTAQHEYWRTS